MDFERTHLVIVESRSSLFARTPLTIVEEPQPNMQNSASQPGDATDLDAEKEPTTDDAMESDTIIDIQQVSETSEEFNDTVKKAVSDVPDNIRQKLKEKGWSVVTCRLLGEAVQAQDQPPVNWNTLSVAILIEPQQVVIPESTYDSQGNETPSLNPDGLLRNALGHVVDSMAPEFVTEHFHDDFSDLESFKYAHVSDVGRLPPDKKQKLTMFVDEADVSRAEMFAEGFAALHGGGSIYTIDVMSKYFPAAMKQIKDIMEAISTGTQLNNNQAQGNEHPGDGEEMEPGGPTQQVQEPQGGTE